MLIEHLVVGILPFVIATPMGAVPTGSIIVVFTLMRYVCDMIMQYCIVSL